jgi:hypothetical protein
VPPPDGEAVHELTFAVWDLPSPVVTGRPLGIKVGAKCSHGCALTGAVVEIRNDAGTLVGSGTVGPAPWEGTSALYWTDVALTGPEVAGPACLTASIAADEEHLHPAASSTLQFVAVNPPEHVVTLKVTNRDTGTGVVGAEVRCGPFRAATDEEGVASIELPSGAFEVTAWKAGFDAASTSLNVAGRVSLELALVAEPVTEEPYWM